MLNFIDQTYIEIVEALKESKRPLPKFNKNQIDELQAFGLQFLTERNEEEFNKVLCILNNTQTLSHKFEGLLIASLAVFPAEKTIIFTLSAAGKQIITRLQREGDRVPMPFIESLRELLYHSNPEVLEWTLRIIEQLGRQGLLLKGDVLKATPSIFTIFNKHKNNSREIIYMLEKRWASFGVK